MIRFTIITACLNSERYIAQSIESVLKQKGDNFEVEHLIIDGKSTDKTLEIVRSYQDKVTLLSEKDNGLYSAMNKGIRMAQGDYVAFLNSDDFYKEDTLLSSIAQLAENSSVDAIFGDVEIVHPHCIEEVIRLYKGNIFTPERIAFGIMPPHPSLFLKTEVLLRSGLFDESLTLSADFELVCRLFAKEKITYRYMAQTFVIMRNGGLSNRWKNKLRITAQDLIGARQNGIKTNYLMISSRFLFKLQQFFIRT